MNVDHLVVDSSDSDDSSHVDDDSYLDGVVPLNVVVASVAP